MYCLGATAKCCCHWPRSNHVSPFRALWFSLISRIVVLARFARWWLGKRGSLFGNRQLSPDYVVQTLLVSNMVGIVFARRLHYQFYVWYFFSVPLLLWISPTYPILVRIGLVEALEWSFFTFRMSAGNGAKALVWCALSIWCCQLCFATRHGRHFIARSVDCSRWLDRFVQHGTIQDVRDSIDPSVGLQFASRHDDEGKLLQIAEIVRASTRIYRNREIV